MATNGAGIGIGIDRHRLDAHTRGLDHAAGDFAAIGDQDLLEHRCLSSGVKRWHVVAEQAQHVGGAFDHVGARAVCPGPRFAQEFIILRRDDPLQ
jgi:hypothetical protein